jgi:hypothetical protein
VPVSLLGRLGTPKDSRDLTRRNIDIYTRKVPGIGLKTGTPEPDKTVVSIGQDCLELAGVQFGNR